jgi:mannose-6-phosphate isomerase-like protein (cupin superfamily)
MPVVDLTEHPTLATEYGRWQPLNGPLGVAGFGISAIVCDPGEEFDVEHDETDSGQQEVYVVVAGRAAFQIGGEAIEAGPGEVVSAPDPAATRSYRALEPGTRIVCIGAPPSGAQDYGAWIAEAASSEIT